MLNLPRCDVAAVTLTENRKVKIMTTRKIIEIDQDKCNGCGQCIPACDEGALEIVNGTAQRVDDKYCDGLGACLGECPQDAIHMVERDAGEFDEEAVEKRQRAKSSPDAGSPPAGGCPGAAAMDFSRGEEETSVSTGDPGESALRQWPVQLHLVPVNAPYLEGADILLAADCVPFAMANFHNALLSGHRLLIGCPKLDDGEAYREKLTAILGNNSVRSLTVAHMEVPCCHGLITLAREALAESGAEVDLHTVEVDIEGQIAE